ncbi:MAG: Protein ArsC [Candidatus Methanofastidiosum methylothiophilum]|uniref:Protein ArsC n=1 Tax=Candidatus Methanofastidiosum methylothiophilum TaxID=1705564 RepID=A0A150J0L3_9EURY|nr:MAG: Protein ArsC [Candidatus Methanofastidiosum methylthiophilus]KYC48373.1 MAG: Protein ArsC [Candidatus Methanofastidiosum methylthiophilus]KYC50762.1 MAG: Protein ArsC [Candidatus Methanofastidiosum methylthiophilus]
MKKKILFICTHNSARSQLAEGLVNTLCSNKFQAFSAGSTPTNVNPYAIEALKEIGIDIKGHYSKSINEFEGQYFDYVVTVCDNARDSCPFFPGAKKYIHASFKDPSSVVGNSEEILNAFRKTRDEIKQWILEFICNSTI